MEGIEEKPSVFMLHSYSRPLEQMSILATFAYPKLIPAPGRRILRTEACEGPTPDRLRGNAVRNVLWYRFAAKLYGARAFEGTTTGTRVLMY